MFFIPIKIFTNHTGRVVKKGNLAPAVQASCVKKFDGLGRVGPLFERA